MRCFVLTAVLSVLGVSTFAATPERTLTFEDRVTAQRAIEQVNWSHRNWPAENKTPKPALATVLPDAVLRAKVENYLRESAALEAIWHRPITPAQLQAEIDRMAAHTKDGAGLRELFDALGNDPFLIAETLARPALANRLIRNWYATDYRLHAVTKKKAEAARAVCRDASCMTAMGGEYRETTWSLRGKDLKDSPRALRAEDWSRFRSDLVRRLAGSAEVLEESAEAFTLLSIKEQSRDRIVTASVSWPKRPFEQWWAGEQTTTPLPALVQFAQYRIPRIDPTPCVPDTWKETSGAPDGHRGHTAVWTGSEMIIWGGWDSTLSSPTNTGARYNPSTDTWAPLSKTGVPAPRYDHAAIWTGSLMIVWGGSSAGGARYNPTSDTWTALATAAAPSTCSVPGVVWTGSEMIVWGIECGYETSSAGRYSPATNSWSPLSTQGAPDARTDFTVVWSGSELIVWGGQGPFGQLNSGGRYNPLSDAWLPTALAGAPSPRSGHVAVWTGSEMVVWGGGLSSGEPRSGGRYVPATNTWLSISQAGAPDDPADQAGVWTGEELIVWGGGFDHNVPGTGGRYRPASNSWLPTTLQGAPTDRGGHSATWTGTEMIVWGGDGNTGGRYDPISDSWAPTSNLPEPRYGHASVWTGNAMIIWGGRTRDTVSGGTRSGAAYSPITDDWSPTSLGDAPSGREGHTAVWTGEEMIVWGGSTDGNKLSQSGGRYRPDFDTWVATPSNGAPEARIRHSAVWTGDEMIVWGGYATGGETNSGGRYRPASDTWTQVSQINPPSPRASHTAVWTGSEMIVWGASLAGPSTGGRYQPGSDSWAPTPLAGAPDGRTTHSAVWTGDEMIVWGGYSSGTKLACFDCWLQSGGRFSPSLNTWTPTTEIGVPERRNEHRALWTGQRMLVFGGNDDLWNLSTGGLYDPNSNAWTPTAVAGAPSPRVNHTLSWTGRQMLAFGGNDFSNITGTGAVYCACPDGKLTYRDADGDGFGSTVPTPSCDGTLQPGYVSNALDCDDSNAAEGVAHTLYLDADGDGYGDAEVAQDTCYHPSGWSVQAGDCNDTSAVTHPGAVESCNAVDDDCDGSVDEDALGVDSDGDQIHNACDNCRSTFNTNQADTDEDSIGNACDNCIVAANAGQQDVDADHVGDVCDNCAASFNPMQRDFDRDRRGDVCDNCVVDFNPSQTDFNHDSQGDACDENDGLIYVYSTDRDLVEWQEEDGQTRWNVYEGDLSILKSGGPYTQLRGSNPLADRHCNVFHGYVADTEPVPAHACKFSLVTGLSGPSEGNLGTNSAGVLRPNIHPCP